MIENNEIEVARAELYAIASHHNLNFLHEDVLAASKRLDDLINAERIRKLQQARNEEFPSDRHVPRDARRKHDKKPSRE